MRYRRFGRSDLEVSEVGFGVWTLASDWWGVVDDKQGLLHAALDAGINFIDTAPVYGSAGFGEELLADVLKAQRDEIVLTTKCGYDIDAARKYPGQSERPHDWEPQSVREQLEASLRRLGTDYIDLYQLHNSRIEPILDDALWEELEKFRAEGKIRELGVALGPAIGWVDEGLEALRRRVRSSRCRPCSTCSSRNQAAPSRQSRVSPAARPGSSRASRTRPTRCRDASHATPSSRRRTTARTATARTCSTTSTRPSACRSSGRAPAAPIGQAAIAGILANPAFTTVLPPVSRVEDVHEYAAGSDMPLTPDEQHASTSFGPTTSASPTATRCR